jgi:hypothetical protein
MNLYAYCLSDELTPDALESINGIQGAAARVVRYESISAVVSDFEGERADVTRENVFAHDLVIRQVLARLTPLPFRFGMVVSAGQLEAYIASRRDSLLSQLARVRNSVEMSVKIIWDAEAVKQAALAEVTREGSKSDAQGPGADFLRAKRREIIGDKALKARAENLAEWLREKLGDSVREAVAQTLSSEAMAVRASHLVERARLREYRERIAQAREERGDLRFLTSGPWPPYSFCKLDS